MRSCQLTSLTLMISHLAECSVPLGVLVVRAYTLLAFATIFVFIFFGLANTKQSTPLGHPKCLSGPSLQPTWALCSSHLLFCGNYADSSVSGLLCSRSSCPPDSFSSSEPRPDRGTSWTIKGSDTISRSAAEIFTMVLTFEL
jgi:hypothetical protein